MERMESTGGEKLEEDESAQGRLRYWAAGLRMAADHPLGVGPGNFHANIGRYLPGDAGRDAHSIYIRCLAELGIPGFILFAAIVCNAFLTLARVRQLELGRADPGDGPLRAFALQMSLILYLMCGIFGSYIYLEMLLVVAAPARPPWSASRPTRRGGAAATALGPRPSGPSGARPSPRIEDDDRTIDSPPAGKPGRSQPGTTGTLVDIGPGNGRRQAYCHRRRAA